jgi:hypothetical protein
MTKTREYIHKKDKVIRYPSRSIYGDMVRNERKAKRKFEESLY